MKKKFIKEPVFESHCRFVWDCSDDELAEYLKKSFGYEMTGYGSRAKMVTIEHDDWIEWIIWTSNFDYFEFIHEISHLVFSIMRFKGIPLSRDTEEVFTHLQSYYLDEIRKFREKKKKK